MFTAALKAVGEAYRQDKDTGSLDGWFVRRIRSGMNNALYRVDGKGQSFACKLCVADERRRAYREYEALSLLARAGVDVAPKPLGLDESETLAPYPAVIYDWLPGAPPGPRVTMAQLQSLVDALHELHALAPAADEALSDAWFHWFDRELYLQELDGFLQQYGGWLRDKMYRGDHLYARLERIVHTCAETVRLMPVAISREAVPLRFCHVDPNPANMICGPDGRLRFVDWEYSGWGDPALDLAEYRWHSGWAAMPRERHTWMRTNYQPPAGDTVFWERVALWDYLLAARWPFLVLRWLYSVHNGSERVRLTLQSVRAGELRDRLVRLIVRAEELLA